MSPNFRTTIRRVENGSGGIFCSSRKTGWLMQQSHSTDDSITTILSGPQHLRKQSSWPIVTADMISATTSRKRARLKSNDEEPQQPPQHDPENDEICSFCRKIPAAVSVQVPVRHRKKRAATLFCLSCYYTTSVVRQDPEKYVSVFNQTQLDEQLPQAQALFSEVFVELRKELEEEAERAFQTQKSDPLAMLHQAPKRRPKALLPPGQKKKEGKKTDGGFLRDVPIPDRLRKTQEDQLQLQRAQMDRMKRAAKQTASSNLYQRRKPSKASIWNLAMAPPKKGAEQQEGIK
eukprot:scaffold4724_cov108-Cylindrotheca_fusiformis.AAC.5